MKKDKRIIILLLGLILIVSVIGTISARYRSKGTATKELGIAYYVIDSEVGEETQSIILDEMVPGEEIYIYTINVSNYSNQEENIKVSETAIEYDLLIKRTTNLPLKFSLVSVDENGNETEEALEITDTQEDIDDGMYYRLMKTGKKEFALSSEGQDHKYILKIEFPKEYVNADENFINDQNIDTKTNLEYADVIELVEITVDSKQKI